MKTTRSLEWNCRRCGGRLELRRAWTSVQLRCRACGAHFFLAEYQSQMDEHLDEELADTRCDRL